MSGGISDRQDVPAAAWFFSNNTGYPAVLMVILLKISTYLSWVHQNHVRGEAGSGRDKIKDMQHQWGKSLAIQTKTGGVFGKVLLFIFLKSIVVEKKGVYNV